MRVFRIMLFVIAATFFIHGYADQSSLAPSHSFWSTVQYRGNPLSQCGEALAGQLFREHFTYFWLPAKKEGSAFVTIQDLQSSAPPIDSTLFPDGDEDRYGFTNYFYPATPISVRPHVLYLRGIIMNICLDGEKQSALMINLPSGKDCLVTTPVWNYCR